MAQPRPKPRPRPRPGQKRSRGVSSEVVGVLVAVAAVLALGIGLLLVFGRGSGSPGPAATSAKSHFPATVKPGQADQNVGEKRPVETGTHIQAGTPGKWQTTPPSSGPHWPAPAPWGPATQAYPPELWVHNLEHGGIAVLFRDSADAATAATFARDAPRETQFNAVKGDDAPYARMDHRFALVAWGWVDFMDAWSDDEALRFYAAHVDRGPEDIP